MLLAVRKHNPGEYSVPRQDHTDLPLSQAMFGCGTWLGRQMSRASPVIPKAWAFPLKQMRYRHGCAPAPAWDWGESNMALLAASQTTGLSR